MPKNKEKSQHHARRTKVLKKQKDTLEMLNSPSLSIKIIFNKLEQLTEQNEQFEKRIRYLEQQLATTKKSNEKKEIEQTIINQTEGSIGNRISRLELH